MISKKISAKISRVSADTDTRKKREYRPIISAGRYIGRSLVVIVMLVVVVIVMLVVMVVVVEEVLTVGAVCTACRPLPR